MASGTTSSPQDPHSAQNQSAAAAAQTVQPATPAPANGDQNTQKLPDVPEITVDTSKFARLVELLTQISKSSEKTNASLSDTLKTVTGVNSNLGKTAISLRAMIESAEHFSDSFEEVNKTLSDIAKSNSTNEKAIEDQVDSLQKMKKYYSDIVASNEASGEELKKTQIQLDGINKALGAIGEKTKDGIYDPEKIADARVELVKTTRELEKQARIKKQLEMLDQKGGRGMLRHNQRLNTLMKSSRVQHWIDVGKQGAERQKTQKDKRNEYRTNFNQKARDAGHGDSFLARIPRDRKTGHIDHTALAERAKNRPMAEGTNYHELAASMGKKGGVFGYVDRKLGGKVLETMDSGRPMGFMGRMGANIMTRGEGSMSRGILSTGMGVAEGGLGAVEGALGASAIPLAIAGLIKTGFDKATEYNSGVEKTFASSGIFSGGGSALQNIDSVRNNLIPRNMLYSPLGVSYNKNLEIAKAIQDTGYNVSDVGRPRTANDQGQFGPGGYGAIQKQVYTTARLAGFDTPSAVANIIKMVTMYNQSLTSTDDFFVKLSKDSKSAGLTTLKYVQIIDEVTGGLGRMNKSFETSVGLLNVLSRSGQTSSENLKTYFAALTTNNQENDMSLRAYAAQQIIANPASHKEYVDSRETVEKISRDNVISALKDAGVSFTDKDLSLSGVHDLKSRVIASDTDSQHKMAASNAIDQYEHNMRKTNAARSNDPLALATALDTEGQDVVDKLTFTKRMMNNTLGLAGTSMSEVLNNKSGAEDKLLQNPVGLLGGKAFGFDDNRAMETFINATKDVIDSAVGGLKQNGVAYDDSGMSNDLYNKFIHNGATTDEDKKSALRDFANTPEGSEKIFNELANNQKYITSLMSKAAVDLTKPIDQKAIMDKATGLNQANQSTDDIMKNFLSSWFLRLVSGIEDMTRWLEKIFGNTQAKLSPNISSGVAVAMPRASLAAENINAKINSGTLTKDQQDKMVGQATLINRVIANGGAQSDQEGQDFIDAVTGATTTVGPKGTNPIDMINKKVSNVIKGTPSIDPRSHGTTDKYTPVIPENIAVDPQQAAAAKAASYMTNAQKQDAQSMTGDSVVNNIVYNTYTPQYTNTKASGGSSPSNARETVTRPNTPAGSN
jgi:hypothetical protein